MDENVGNQTPKSNQNKESNISTNQIVWLPSVVEDKKPKEGMIFKSLDEAFTFYNSYAKEGGFGVRKSTNRIDKKTGEEVFKIFVCHKEGSSLKNKYVDNNEGPKRRRTILREECRALLSLKKNDEGLWIVVKFIEGHSHGLLSPSKTQFLPSHRGVSSSQRELLKTLSAVNVGTSQTMDLLDMEAGGHEYVGCQERDLHNAKRDDREKIKGQDAQMLIDHFEVQKQNNPSFFYRYEIDSEDCLTCVFWADATCRLNYNFFGDVVVFDTTYKTNKYDMIFSPFTGVNHHYQSIYFGFGFLHDETTESFCWLFKCFLECMPVGGPNSIITDQDPAMAKAIRLMFPNVIHRWCIWHITQKLPIKLGSKLHEGNFDVSFHDLVKNCESPSEFEEEWHNLIISHELDGDKWLTDMYANRHMWVNAYLKQTFFAGMTSSQRSESHHSALKKCLSRDHTFIEFILRLEHILSKQRTKELAADQESFTCKPKLQTTSPLEAHMAGIYTKHIFYMFQTEFSSSGFDYSCRMVSEDENKMQYNVHRLQVSNKGRVVVYDKNTMHLTCSCRMFEFEGIPCRHLLFVLRLLGFKDLPSTYILKRWCKDAKKGVVIDNNGDEITLNKYDPRTTRFREIRHNSDKLAEHSCTSQEDLVLMNTLIFKTLEEFKALRITPSVENQSINEGKNEVERTCQVESNLVNQVSLVNEPSQCRPKGCGRRLKSRMEKIMSKPRLCRACGKRGVQHDSRNCPAKQKWVQDNDEYEEDSNDEDNNIQL